MTSGDHDPVDPTRKLMDLWTEAARGYTDAVESFWTAAGDAMKQAPAQAADPAASFEQMGRAWQDGLANLASLQARFVERVLEGMPDTAEGRIEAQTFGQLRRMAEGQWQESLERMAQTPADLAGGLQGADPERLGGLWQSLVREYLADLEAMPADAFKLDLAPLAEAWGKVAAGQGDADARKMIDRLAESAAVKLRHGSEVYADPDSTQVGLTPRECVHEQGKLRLYRYSLPEDAEPVDPAVDADPVLIVYSIINRPYILDLLPGFSFVEHLLQQGLDVYLIDWGETEIGDRTTTLDSYIDPGIGGCVDAIRARTGAGKVSLFGHCIRGNLALMYAALHPDDVARLITLTTPITAAEGGVVALWTDPAVFPVDAVVDSTGHMPAKLIRYTFMAIKPYYEVMKWKMFLENLGNDAVMTLFMPVDRWANENVDIPGEAFRKFIREVLHDDRFRRGETRINGRKVELSAIDCPLMNLTATKDWIVPPESADFLGDLVGSEDTRLVHIDGAHVGIMIDPRARPIWTTMSDFLLESDVD